jgi:nucleoside-diphosphate-sugar epimerase
MKKVVVAGNLGFIGSNLTLECLRRGYKVTGIDNCSAGDPRHNNTFRDYPHYKFYKEDICNTDKMIELFKDVEIVFLLAALPRVSYSTDFPIETNHSNVDGTLSVLEAARKSGVKRVVYAGSSSRYGGSDIPFPTPEITSPNTKSNYALQKEVGVQYCRLYSELYGLDTASLIFFNVYGPYQEFGGSYSTCISAFFHAAVTGEACRIDGDGSNSRDVTYVENVVQANILAANHPEKLNGEVFNIGCGETYTVNEVYAEVCKLTGKKLDFYHAPERKGDPKKSLADISKAQRILGYEPKIKFVAGMEKTWAWWQQKMKGAK